MLNLTGRAAPAIVFKDIPNHVLCIVANGDDVCVCVCACVCACVRACVCVSSERRGSVVVSTPAYHAADRGSNPARTRRDIGVKTWLSTLEIVYLCVFRMRH